MDARELEAARLLANTLMGAGRYAAARDVLAGLAEADSGDRFARRNLVLALLRLGEYAAAEPLARSLAEGAEGADRAAALFFHAHALWGVGSDGERRAAVDRYAEYLSEKRRGSARYTDGR